MKTFIDIALWTAAIVLSILALSTVEAAELKQRNLLVIRTNDAGAVGEASKWMEESLRNSSGSLCLTQKILPPNVVVLELSDFGAAECSGKHGVLIGGV